MFRDVQHQRIGSPLRTVGRQIQRLLAACGLLTLLVIATPLDLWWAHAYAGPMEQPAGDILIVLGSAGDDQGVLSYSSYWRAHYALRAWQTGTYKKLVVSGGGEGIPNFLIAEGVPAGAILAESRSRSTRENGLNTAQLLKVMPGRKVLLTSDFHMLRALKVFRTLGVDVRPFPVPDVMKQSQQWYGRVSGFETLVVESLKIADYKRHGWI